MTRDIKIVGKLVALIKRADFACHGWGISIFSAVLLLAGCAAQVSVPGDTGSAVLQFQRGTLAPAQGERLIDESALSVGDILLSADDRNGVSLGIRAVSFSTVSHAALYVGDGNYVEAIHSGVRLRTTADMKDSQSVIAVYRYPGLDNVQHERLRFAAQQRIGTRYNFTGVALQAPFMFTRRLCEVPLLPGETRHYCYSALALVQMAALDREGLFCSEFVAETFREAGVPLTTAASRWISPNDILHMREGDVSGFKASSSLVYVGHLKTRELVQSSLVIEGQ